MLVSFRLDLDAMASVPSKAWIASLESMMERNEFVVRIQNKFVVRIDKMKM